MRVQSITTVLEQLQVVRVTATASMVASRRRLVATDSRTSRARDTGPNSSRATVSTTSPTGSSQVGDRAATASSKVAAATANRAMGNSRMVSNSVVVQAPCYVL